jgi:hypothetical protein
MLVPVLDRVDVVQDDTSTPCFWSSAADRGAEVGVDGWEHFERCST